MSGERKLYKIGHLTKELGVTSRTIRYYEQFGLLPHIKRSEGNVRLFDQEDLELIRKIRKMQKEEYLPLDVIREKLFNKSSSTKKTQIVITDSGSVSSAKLEHVRTLQTYIVVGKKTYKMGEANIAQKMWKDAQRIHIRPQVVPPTVEEFVECYKKCAAQGFKHVYSIHSSSSILTVIQNAQTAAKRVADLIAVKVVDTKTIGPATGIFIEQVDSIIDQDSSSEEVSRFITKQVPLLFNLLTTPTLQYFVYGGVFNDKTAACLEIIQKLFDYKPVIMIRGDSGEFDIINSVKTDQEVVPVIAQALDEEIKSRGGYISKVVISYASLFAESGVIANELKSLFPTTDIEIIEDNGTLSSFSGPNLISVSVA